MPTTNQGFIGRENYMSNIIQLKKYKRKIKQTRTIDGDALLAVLKSSISHMAISQEIDISQANLLFRLHKGIEEYINEECGEKI